MAKCREIREICFGFILAFVLGDFNIFLKISSVLQKWQLLTNNYPTVIIPHRDSIWTQNYTLAEITGILYKQLARTRESGTDGI